MQIQWLGQSCFKIQAKNHIGEVTIITDPYDPYVGFNLGKVGADIVTISHEHKDHSYLEAIKGEPFIISTPGEFETRGIFVYGIHAFHDDKHGAERGGNTVYLINAEDMNIVHLGDLGHELNNEQMERMSNIDVLLVPVGGGPTIDLKKAVDIISQIEPRIVIPMHYSIPGSKLESLKPLDEFLKVCGMKPEIMDKLKISKKDLPQDNTKLIVLSSQA